MFFVNFCDKSIDSIYTEYIYLYQTYIAGVMDWCHSILTFCKLVQSAFSLSSLFFFLSGGWAGGGHESCRSCLSTAGIACWSRLGIFWLLQHLHSLYISIESIHKVFITLHSAINHDVLCEGEKRRASTFPSQPSPSIPLNIYQQTTTKAQHLNDTQCTPIHSVRTSLIQSTYISSTEHHLLIPSI
jgi:hypothetical protein